MVKFSIVTVCLNSEQTIDRCIQSVLNQSFGDYEHIVVDGLSRDKTLEIVNKYSHIKCISEQDKGIYDAMNKGVALCQGKYVLFLNSDDELLPDFLLQCDKIKETDFISNAISMINGTKITYWTPSITKRKGFLWSMPIPHAGLVVKKSVFDLIGPFDLKFKIAADYDFVIKLLLSDFNGCVIQNPQFNFYLGGVSNTSKIIKENHLVRLKNYNNNLLLTLAYVLDIIKFFKRSLF